MITVLLLSIVSTLVLSGIISLGFFFITPNIGAAVFFVSLAFQWIVMHPINRLLSIKSQKLELKRLEKLAEVSEIESKQITSLACSYCGEQNAILVDVNAENNFVCKFCKNDNKVVLQYSTVRTTEPLLTDLQHSREDVYGKLADIKEELDDSDE